MELEQFKVNLGKYTHESASANSEAGKAFLFLEFVRKIFGDVEASTPHRLYPDLERHIKSEKTVLIKGRVDAFLGNLIIEFEENLKEKKMHEATSQLKRYTAILWNNKGFVDYLCIATDGLSFVVFRPRSKKTEDFTEDSIELQRVDSFDIRIEDSATIYKSFDRYMLYHTLVPPTSEEIVTYFGSKGVIFSDCMSLLSDAWDRIHNEIGMIYHEWAKYLSIVYGSEVDNKDLFLRHTYLATLAKMMVYSYYEENTLPTSKEMIIKILTGQVFREHGIENFLVEDFFSWIVKPNIDELGVRISYRIIEGLERFNLTQLNEDIFKELYQQLVDPVERRDLGEFYTPDWLAEMMVEETMNDPKIRVLDPSCGSGTFLASTIRRKMTLLKNAKPADKVKTIVQTVFGMDIHPLAILVSKSNYLMAMGDALTKKEGTIVIPVYMSDTILYPVPKRAIATFGTQGTEEVFTYRVDNQSEFILPKSLVDAESADYIIDNIKEFALRKIAEPELSDAGFKTYLSKRYGVTNDQFAVIIESVHTLVHLIRNNKDSIHPFVLKNIYKPSTIGRFDLVIGNPPWISYRYVRNVERQAKLKELIIQKYGLLDGNQERLITQMDIATLFFVRCADVYLEEGGTIAFVLPRGVFSSDQHAKFRENNYSPLLSYYLLYDLEKNQKERVSPLFSVESCVIFGRRDNNKPTKYPIPTKLMVGRLPFKNVTLEHITKFINEGKFSVTEHQSRLAKVGARVSWNYDIEVMIKKSQSPYMEEFRQGATIVPRMFWFAKMVSHRKFGIDTTQPYLESSKRSLQMAKKEYRGIKIAGKVESDYLFSSLLGSDILPFCSLPSRLVVIPAEKQEKNFLVLKKESVQARGHRGMYQWLVQVEEAWRKGRASKIGKMNAYQRLDYSKGLTSQNHSKELIVLYNGAGRGNLSACVVNVSDARMNNEYGLKTQGFIAEHDTYYYYPKDEDEANFITAILNSDLVFNILRTIKSARHIQKKVWELPIPTYDSKNKLHIKLAELGKKCAEKAKAILEHELKAFESIDAMQTTNTGILRKNIKSQLPQEMTQINQIVASLLQ